MATSYEFIVQVAPGEDGLSPVYRNKACDTDLPLTTSWQGARTCWETFAGTVARVPNSRCLGYRPIRQGLAGPFVFESYQKVAEDVYCIARSLHSCGLTHGSRVGIYGRNSPTWIKTMIACSAFGGVCVPLYDSLGPQACSYIISHSEMEAVFVQADKFRDLVSSITSLVIDANLDAPTEKQLALKHCVVWGVEGGGDDDAGGSVTSVTYVDEVCGDVSYDALAAKLRQEYGMHIHTWEQFITLYLANARTATEGQRHSFPSSLSSPPQDMDEVAKRLDEGMRRPSPEDLATIMYTSGTTGVPKGVMLTHRALISTVASQLTFMHDPLGRARLAALTQQLQFGTLLGSADLTAASNSSAGFRSRHSKAQAAVPAGVAGAGQSSGRVPDPAGVAADPLVVGGLAVGDQNRTWDVSRFPDVMSEAGRWPRFEAGDVHFSYLPLAHIYERALMEAALTIGAGVGCWQGDVDKVQDDAAALRPAMFVGVPRVWDRIKSGVQRKLAARTPIARRFFNTFYNIKLNRLRAGNPASKASWLGDMLVFRKVQAALGGRVKLVISGAAPLPREQEEFIRTALACHAGQGYGLTETCSANCVALPDRWDMVGTVGPIQTCVEMRLESVPDMGYDATSTLDTRKGELLLKGPCCFSGYYKNPDATCEVLQSDGWFHTGDIVELLPSGALRIIDRKKNLVKLAQGEYVAVEAVETVLKGRLDQLLNQLWVYGDSLERRLVAVAVPDRNRLMAWWRSRGAAALERQAPIQAPAQAGVTPPTISTPPPAAAAFPSRPSSDGGHAGVGDDDDDALWRRVCLSREAKAYVLNEMRRAALDARLPPYQHVAAVHLEPEGEWTPEGDLLTPTHKLKRHALAKRYAGDLSRMYHEIA